MIDSKKPAGHDPKIFAFVRNRRPEPNFIPIRARFPILSFSFSTHAHTVQHFRTVVRFATGTSWAAKALDQIGRLAMAQHRYAEAREVFEPLCTVYYQYRDVCMMSRIYIGRCYEAEGDVEAAAHTYADVEQFHPWTPLWIEAPIYSALLYEHHGQRAQAMAAYRQAIQVYLRRLRAAPPYAMDRLQWQLVEAYEGVEAWSDAVQVLEEALAAGDPTFQVKRPEMWYKFGRLFEERLRQPQKALAAYQQLIKEFPDHALTLQAMESIKRLAASQ